MVALHATLIEVDERSAMEAELQRLLLRLEDGFDKIARAAANGEDVARWEDVWLKLLGEYEQLYDRLDA
jgi:hypothetical protein